MRVSRPSQAERSASRHSSRLSGLRRPQRYGFSELKGIYFFAFIMFLMMGAYPQLYAGGVDTTITGITPQKSAILPIKVLISLPLAYSALLMPKPLEINRLWPILLFVGLCGLSTIWSSAPYVTGRAAFELLLATSFALALSSRYTVSGIALTIYISLSMIVLASALTAILLPRYGIHNPGDMLQSVHAGHWRGVFGHKNLLGQLTSVHLVFALIYASYQKRHRYLNIVIAGISLLTLIMTNSATGYTITGVGILSWMIFLLPKTVRALALIFAAILASILGLLRIDLASAALGMLGRDATLTGRTAFWGRALDQLGDHWLLGRGYGNTSELGSYLQQRFGSGAVDVHSGYIDTLTTLGSVGLVLLLSLMLSSVIAANQRVDRVAEPYKAAKLSLAVLPLLWIVAALSEVSPVRPQNGLLLCALTAAATLMRSQPWLSEINRK